MLSFERIRMVKKAIVKESYDALFCRLSVNVLSLMGYWPGNHAVAAVIPAQGKPTIVVAETEYTNVCEEIDSTIVEIEPYQLEDTSTLKGITQSMCESALPRVFKKMGIEKGIIGIEESFEEGASARTFGDFKYPSKPTWDALKSAFQNANFVDATNVINKLRWIKTQNEIKCIKKSIEIACIGFEAGRKSLKPGMTESDLSAVIEAEILSQGTGRNGGEYSRAFTSIYAGRRSAMQCAHWVCSSGREIKENDMVIIELGSVTDGYWCDLTRNMCAGKPSDRAISAMEMVLEAQKQGVSAIKPGAKLSDIDKACHDYFEILGYGVEYYKHSCGHGVGFNYHEGPPVHKANDMFLEEGMVLCIEPGIYFENELGVRAEDMFVVTKDGSELISTYPHNMLK